MREVYRNNLINTHKIMLKTNRIDKIYKKNAEQRNTQRIPSLDGQRAAAAAAVITKKSTAREKKKKKTRSNEMKKEVKGEKKHSRHD